MREAAESRRRKHECVRVARTADSGRADVDATAHRGVAAIRDALARQLYLPVRWSGCVATLATAGATRIAECGPGKVLAGLVKRIDKSLEGRSLGTPAEFDTALESWRS